MARKKKKKSGGIAGDAWLITFGDLVTLLLTFFVLLLSMSSMDRSVLSRITVFTDDIGFLTYRSAGRIPTRVKHIIEALDKPWEVLEKQNRIKDLLFPDDVLPESISRQDLMKNLQILERPEGVALVLSDDLLFKTGQSEPGPAARQILATIAGVLKYMTAPVNIAGYTDNIGGDARGNYVLSGKRALSVLHVFLQEGIPNERFSVSGYGPNWAIADNKTPEGRAKNRRVEILIKTTPWLGSYTQ
ncbi:OmpA/MotB family protein [Desulfobaculum bizertense]|uniref:Chemotaxis protein MotB n=1 Tax=Desulfobaculum bizertense DSM 18034 TaxID=1121442 RepID=A0A1T4X021_9BACT|nr:flagellar motor protein MotB [Desulfobaculum bizertense]UIJ37333.1 flagellar motor protein MotB [Desulfobaculum bizertense]SKA82952.1 chemotaxis protein MotB [Desulfobaculum bizertense DSM 18034]